MTEASIRPAPGTISRPEWDCGCVLDHRMAIGRAWCGEWCYPDDLCVRGREEQARKDVAFLTEQLAGTRVLLESARLEITQLEAQNTRLRDVIMWATENLEGALAPPPDPEGA